jgi:hypothetical protein
VVPRDTVPNTTGVVLHHNFVFCFTVQLLVTLNDDAGRTALHFNLTVVMRESRICLVLPRMDAILIAGKDLHSSYVSINLPERYRA